jgi:hypothetical protein
MRVPVDALSLRLLDDDVEVPSHALRAATVRLLALVAFDALLAAPPDGRLTIAEGDLLAAALA